MVDNKVVIRIARKIRAMRLQRNMTIQEVASRANVTKGLVSRIENARTIPSLPVFVDLLHSLGISLKDFFDDMLITGEKNFLVIRHDKLIPVDREGRPGFRYSHIFSQTIPNCTLEVTLLSIEPGAKSLPTVTDGFEMKYMLEGECDYMIDKELISLQEGDTLYFNASTPHVPVN